MKILAIGTGSAYLYKGVTMGTSPQPEANRQIEQSNQASCKRRGGTEGPSVDDLYIFLI